MALTKHQLLHLNSVLESQTRDKTDPIMMDRLRGIKGETLTKYNIYLDDVKTKVNKIISSGVWPSEVKDPSDIHDYLEGRD